MKRLMLITSLMLVAGFSFAAENVDANYFKISKVTLTEVIPTDEEIYLSNLNFDESYKSDVAPLNTFDIGEAAVILDQVILIGEKIVNIIKAGAPVVNISRDSVSALPRGVPAWQTLGGWKVPVVRAFDLTVQNLYGAKVIDVRLKVSATTGGSYDGKGQYLSNVYFSPTYVKVLWGFNLDLWMENQEPVNLGTRASPVAGLGVDLRYKITTALPLSQAVGAQSYFVSADGKIRAL